MSSLICSSPQLFAACHVLLRRHVPRHPPYALCSLIFLVYLSLHTKKILISTRLIAARPFGFTLFIRSFRINQLALLFLICLSYYAFLFYYAVVNLRVTCKCSQQRSFDAFGLTAVKALALCDLSQWWAQVDSNHRPHAYQACALTS